MQIGIRRARVDDCYDLWVWRNHPEVLRWCLDSSKVSYSQHKKWFSRKINDVDTVIYIAENDKGEKLAQVRFDCKDGNTEISVNLNPEFIGKGIGWHIIKIATQQYRQDNNKEVFAVIKEENVRSQKSFSKAGYVFEKIINKNCEKAFLFRSPAQRNG